MGVYGKKPSGNAGRGRHTGRIGWLGGKHRDNSGCFDVIIAVAGVGTLLAVAVDHLT